MKQREPRRQTLIAARLRDAAGWSDARILNMSSRGLLVGSRKPPRPGAYVEICRGTWRIVARVVWAAGDRFGVRTQEEVRLDPGSGTESAAANASAPERLRRRAPSPEERLARSRAIAGAAQFLCLVALGIGASALAYNAVAGALAQPLAQVSAHMPARR